MEKIKRFDLQRIDYEDFDMIEEENGQYVLYENHAYILKEYENEISDLQDEINYLRDRYT